MALRYGLHEPVTMHPVVSAEACIGTGNCIRACPEDVVLGMRGGQAHVVSPARCIGHGLCERVCPVEAIQLVFGTEKRGVAIPRVRENFETNVPGIYIIGELGGMGLIRNAFEQGRQCIAGIAREECPTHDDLLDVLIVGCGPAGLAASLACQHHRLRFQTLEKEDIGGTVRSYPRKKLVLTSPVQIPGYGKLRYREISKERLVEVWEDVVRKTGLEVNPGETASTIERNAEGFVVTSDRNSYRARRVVLAIGRRGIPRKLGIPGEELPTVAYSLREAEAYGNDRIVVVGGGDSAVEAALALSEHAREVKISYRRERFSRIKPANLERIEHALERGLVDVLWSTNLIEIRSDRVILRDQHGATRTLPNDAVFIFAGGALPTAFLQACGVAIDTKFGQP